MAETIQMPKLGFDMAEGTLVRWRKDVGEAISKGEVIAEIETDKATIEIESTATGTVLKRLVNEGEVVPVGADIAVVGEAGESVAEAAPAARPAPAETVEAGEAAAPAATTPASSPAPPAAIQHGDGQLPGGVRASPLARRIARDKGVDLTQVQGSGPGGRIVKRDVEGFTPAQAPAAPAKAAPMPAAAPSPLPAPVFGPLPEGPDVEIVPLSKLRGRIGRRMTEAKQ